MTFVWALALIGSVLGGFTLLSVAAQNGAPQQAAVAVIAVGLAVIPYCFARAIAEISDGSGRKWHAEPVDDAAICQSCGESIRPRKSEKTCYLCGGPLVVPARPETES